MIAACKIAESICHFDRVDTNSIKALIEQYHLPTQFQFDKEKIWEVLKMDKKRAGNYMNFILLNRIGEASIHAIPLQELENLIN